MIELLRRTRSRIGFTGTRRPITNPQYDGIYEFLSKYIGTFSHGDCIGADAVAHDAASNLEYYIVVYPPINPKNRAWKKPSFGRIEPPAEYHDRNHAIVDNSDRMLATPKEKKEILRSGTWSAIRYARKLGRPIHIIFPDGTTQQENW